MSDPAKLLVTRLDKDLPLPSYAHDGDAGLDLRTATDAQIKPGERVLLPTGVAVAIPNGYAGFVQPRSGLATKLGMSLVNSPGLIDSGYRGEIKVIAINHDPDETINLSRGDKIAQMVILAVPHVVVDEVAALPDSTRGLSGFGSTGA